MEHAFKVDLRGIIDLLSNHLYSDPSVFIRELLQNGVDAITARRHRGDTFEPAITARLHRTDGELPCLEFHDNGVGLSEAEVHEFLATIGRSSKRIGEARDTFLGQFGIGLLSCFMVSGEIEVTTQSAAGGPPVRWLAQADGTYTLETLPIPETLQPGTTVVLRAREDTDFYFEYDELRGALRRYGQILPFPIHVSDGEQYEHVNAVLPPWLAFAAGDTGKREEVLAYVREEFNLEAFDVIPLGGDGGLRGVALILPYSTGSGNRQWHQVYLKRMLLGNDVRNLLPEWAFFVRCLINVEGLHPTASRESFYEDDALGAARAGLDAGLRAYIEGLARQDPARLDAFIALHHLPIKALATENDDFYKLLIHEFTFETSTGRMKLGEYVARETVLRLVTNLDQFRQIAQIASAYGHGVINAVYTYDVPLLRKYTGLFGKELEVVDAQSYAMTLEDVNAGGLDGLLSRANEALSELGCEVSVKRFAPAELPALLIVTEEQRQLGDIEAAREVADDLFSEFLDDYEAEYEDVRVARLHLNLDHPLVQELLHVPDGRVFTRLIQTLYVQAHLLGHHPMRSQELALLGAALGDMMHWGLRVARQETLN